MEVRVLPCAPIHQGVGEPGRPCLPWKQETGGSNPPTLTILLPIGQMPEWLGSALQKRPRRFNSGSGLHAPVARAERHRSSKSGHAGSNPVWSSTLLGANSARTIAQDIVVIVVLLLRWATGGCALEDQLLFHGRVAQRMSADFLHRRMHVRIVSRSPTWRVNWAGAQRRLLSDRPG